MQVSLFCYRSETSLECCSFTQECGCQTYQFKYVQNYCILISLFFFFAIYLDEIYITQNSLVFSFYSVWINGFWLSHNNV